MKTNRFIELSNLCQWNEPNEIKQILEQDNLEVDIIHNEGELFKIAAIKGYPEVLTVLIDHYKKSNSIGDKTGYVDQHLHQFDKNNKAAELKLNDIIEDIVNMGTILDDKVKTILTPYIRDYEEDNYQDIDGDIEYMLNNMQKVPEIDDSDVLGDINSIVLT